MASCPLKARLIKAVCCFRPLPQWTIKTTKIDVCASSVVIFTAVPRILLFDFSEGVFLLVIVMKWILL